MTSRASSPTAVETGSGRERALLRVLDRVQAHVPLVERPFAAVAADVGLDESEVLDLLREAKERRLVRQFSAIFDAAALGYRSSLVAARYPEDRLDEAAAIISDYPGVSHNYRRAHAFNLWYTVAVPPGESLEDVVDDLARSTRAERTLLLPTIRRFKLAVRLDVSGEREPAAPAEPDDAADQPAAGVPLTPVAIEAVRALQDDFPLDPLPFHVLAARQGLDPADLLAAARALHAAGALRRLAAILRHREAGFRANGMVAWRAAQEQCDGAGRIMAAFPEVTHCYQRPTSPDWPYSLFTMIHARSEPEVEASAAAISAATGLDTYEILYSTTEYKKRRVRYFTDEWDSWKAARGAR